MRGSAVRLTRALTFLAAFAGGGVFDAAAQTPPQGGSAVLAPGSRVRVSAPAIGRVVGTLLDAPEDSVRIELASGSSLSISKASLAQLEVSAGVRRSGWRGAGIGALVGAGIGGAVGLATYRRTSCEPNPVEQFLCGFVDQTSREVTVIADAALAGTAGAILGGLLGQIGRESWVRVPVAPRSVRVGFVRAAGLGLRIGM